MMMMFLSSSGSAFSTAFLLALLFSTQWVDARGFAMRPTTGSGPAVKDESGEDSNWSDETMALSINIGNGVEFIPDVTQEVLEGKCTEYYAPNVDKARKICRKFLLDPPPCGNAGKLRSIGPKQWKCCCKA